MPERPRRFIKPLFILLATIRMTASRWAPPRSGRRVFLVHVLWVVFWGIIQPYAVPVLNDTVPRLMQLSPHLTV